LWYLIIVVFNFISWLLISIDINKYAIDINK